MGKKRKCRKMMQAIFAGSPDLVAGAESLCNSRKAAKKYLSWGHARVRRYYLEEVLGDQASITLFNRDEDRTTGSGSEMYQEERDYQQELLGLQTALIQQKNVNNKIAQSLAMSEQMTDEQKNKQQQNILYAALALLVIVFVVTKMKS